MVRNPRAQVRNFPLVLSWFLALCGLLSAQASGVTVVVNTVNDFSSDCAATGTGLCSLRDAINFSNSHAQLAGPSLIAFNIPGSGVQTISLVAPLPQITAAVVIDGYSQPGASPNALDVGNDAVLLVQVLGGIEVAGGVTLLGGSTIKGLVISEITLTSCCNAVSGNFVGLDPTGTVLLGGGGIVVSSSRNVIGGTTPQDRNALTSRGGSGVVSLLADENQVSGNYIGTNAAGTAAFYDPVLGSRIGAPGVYITGSSNTVGGSSPSARNVISGNTDGVVLDGAARPPGSFPAGNIVAGNFIGTDATGTVAILNFGAPGLAYGGVFVGNNVLGTSLSAGDVGNVIDYPYNGFGVSVTDCLDGNSVFFNTMHPFSASIPLVPIGPGIQRCSPGFPTPPVLTHASLGSRLEIHGTLSGHPNRTFRIQVFSNHSSLAKALCAQANPFGTTGEIFLGDTMVTTNAQGAFQASFKIRAGGLPFGNPVTATATEANSNDTSQFSNCRSVVGELQPVAQAQ